MNKQIADDLLSSYMYQAFSSHTDAYMDIWSENEFPKK